LKYMLGINLIDFLLVKKCDSVNWLARHQSTRNLLRLKVGNNSTTISHSTALCCELNGSGYNAQP
jgi:hypothetical protein